MTDLRDKKTQIQGRSKNQGHCRSGDTCILIGLTLSGFQQPAEYIQDKATVHISDWGLATNSCGLYSEK